MKSTLAGGSPNSPRVRHAAPSAVQSDLPLPGTPASNVNAPRGTRFGIRNRSCAVRTLLAFVTTGLASCLGIGHLHEVGESETGLEVFSGGLAGLGFNDPNAASQPA